MNDAVDRLAALSPAKRALLEKRLAAATPPRAAERIAIVSAGCRFPGGATSPQAYWQLLIDGCDAVTDVPPARWNAAALFDADPIVPHRIQSRCGAFLDDIDRFDAAFFGISPREAATMDPQQRLLLEVAWEALEAGGQAVDQLAESATGVFIGAHSQSSDYYLLQLAQRDGIDSHASTGSAHSILANRVSYAFDLRGPSMTVDTACSSSLVAVHLACQSLRSGECDLALAGGVNLMLLPSSSLGFSKLQILSPHGRCRSFDAAADGIVRGEGCGLVVLKRLSDALRDGDPVLALIAGTAVNQDGASNGLTAPNGPAQEAVIRRALKMAEFGPERIGLVETHGTGTPLGDPVEVEALARVLGDTPRPCLLGAVKTQIGHLEAAAGIAGLIKAVWCVREGVVPANLHYTQPNPHLALDDTPFVIPTAPTSWPATRQPRAAGVSSFGFGGTNAHAVIEQYIQAPRTATPAEPRDELLTVSARDCNGLAHAARGVATALRALPEATLADAVHTATARRSHHAHRIAVVGATPHALADALEARLADRAVAPAPADAGLAVWVYTGQGGLWPGVGRALYDSEAVFRAALDDVAGRWVQRGGWGLLPSLLDVAAADRLAATEVAQPTLFALQVALTALWRSWGLRAGAVVGHSVGEVAAAHAAGVLSLDDAVQIVHERSRAMQPAFAQGRMAQVECDAPALQRELDAAGGALSIAAMNGPTSTVLSGSREALQTCAERLSQRGIAVRELAVEYAFHSAQMAPFVSGIVAALQNVRPLPASIPIASTVSGRWASADDFNAAYWGRNVREPVRFAPAIAQLLGDGFEHFLEIGPHPALGTGMQAQADAVKKTVTLASSLRREQPARATLLSNLGKLYEAGATIDWAATRDARRRVVLLPIYPWQRQRHWLDAPDAAALAFSVTGHAGPAVRADATTCYAMTWPEAGGMASTPPFDVDALRQLLETAARSTPEARALAAQAAPQAALERRAAALARRAMRSFGVADEPGVRSGADAHIPGGIAAHHMRLWHRLLRLAEQTGHLAGDSDGWRVTPPHAMADGMADRETDVAGALLERCGAALPAVLRGDADPLALLFPTDGSDSAVQLYADTASARLYNGLAAAAVAQLAHDAGRPLRMIEIGAGTGATTAALLPVLPAGTRYCYTDVSPLFLHEAEARLRDTRVSFSFRRFDVEQPPDTQGMPPAGFDVVIAANVLHATIDLRRTLQHVRALLAPGGVLLLVETVAQRAWADLTFGLTAGWWRFDDAPLRSSDALLAPPQWEAVLREAGFDPVQSIGDVLSRDAIHPQALMVARAAHVTTPQQRLADTTWHVRADRAGFGARLAAAIRREGGDCVEPDGMSAAARPLDGIVYCGALDVPNSDAMTHHDLDAAIAAGVGSALTSAQDLATATHDTRLWLVTRGAQPVLPSDRAPAPAQALLWGLGRSIALEDPRHWGGLVDLDPAASDDDAVAAMINTLVARDGEDQVAWRAGTRHVARLAARAMPPVAAPTLDSRATYLVTGGYGGLGPKVTRWLADCGARCVVLIGRRGPPTTADDPTFHEAMRTLRDRAVNVVFERADVADAAAMRSLFDRFEREGRAVRGVVHAAAAIRFEALHALSPDALLEALRAKVHGSWVLHELTRGRPTDVFVLFSSGTTLFGAKGLAAYAAANQFLGALAVHRAAHGLNATCVDWGAWSDIRLLDDRAAGDIERLGFRRMRDNDAFAVLGSLVQARVTSCMVANIDWPTAGGAYQAHGRRPFLTDVAAADALPSTDTAPVDAAPAVPRRDLRADLAAAPPRARRERMATALRSELARVLGLPGATTIDPAKGYFELGLDSLMAMQLRRRLDDLFNVALPATVIFNHPSVTQLSDHLLTLLGLADDVAAPVPTEPSTAAADAVGDMSDDDVRRALEAELQQLDGVLDAAPHPAAARGHS